MDPLICTVVYKTGLNRFFEIFKTVKVSDFNCLKNLKLNLETIKEWVDKLKPGAVSENAQKVKIFIFIFYFSKSFDKLII